MSVEDAARVADGAGGVAKAGRRVFVESTPGGGPAESLDEIRQRPGLSGLTGRLSHWLVVQYQYRLDAPAKRQYFVEHRLQTRADRDPAIARLVHDGCQVRQAQARVEGMADEAYAHCSVGEGQVVLGIPGQGSNAVAQLQAAVQQGPGQPGRPLPQSCVGDPLDLRPNRGNDFRGGMPLGGVIEKLVDGQSIRLHTRQTRGQWKKRRPALSIAARPGIRIRSWSGIALRIDAGGLQSAARSSARRRSVGSSGWCRTARR